MLAVVLALSPLPAAQQGPTFRSAVRMIEVDVVVTGRDGQPIRGLTRDDFEIIEQDRPQEIRTFSVIDLPFESPRTLADLRTVHVEPDVVTNLAPEGRTYVLVLDAGEANLRARHVAERWLDEVVQPYDRVAVVHTQGTWSSAQPFTSHRRLILAAVDRLLSMGSVTSGQPPGWEQVGSLSTLREVAERLGSVSGRRKAIVWLGGDVNLHPEGDYDRRKTVEDVRREARYGAVLDEWRRVVEAAANNNVAIYPVDHRGLTDSLGMGELMRIASLREVAEETGGTVTGVSSNDFSAGFASIVRDASHYYLLGYTPDPDPADGKFHDIRVRVKRPDVTVRARRGYYAPDSSRAAPAAAPSSLPAGVSPEAAAALRKPVPTPGLGVDVMTLPLRGADRAHPVLIGAHIHGRDLDLAPGRTLAVSYQVFDVEGKVAAGAYKVFELKLEPARRQIAAETGFRFVESVPLRPGRYELRLVAEHADGALGSVLTHIEVPEYGDKVFMSGIAVAAEEPAREIPLTSDTLPAMLRTPPTARRSFQASERLTATVELYVEVPRAGEPEDLEVTGSIAPVGGAVVRRITAREVRGRAPGAYAFRAEVSLNGLAPGRYALTLEARGGDRRQKPGTKQIAFSIEG